MAAIKQNPLAYASLAFFCATGAYLFGAQIATLPLRWTHPVSGDPEGIYQFDKRVGVMEGAKVDEEKGLVYFRSITEDAKFNTAADFVYNNYILHISSIEGAAEAAAEGKEERKLSSVYCLIVDRVK